MITNRKYKKGFTLVELLVVIAILGIIASMVGISASYIMKKARLKNQYTELETSVKTCSAVFLEISTGFTGINVGDVNEFKSRIGDMVKKVENVTSTTFTAPTNTISNDEMYIYYKYDNKYTDSSDAPVKYYLYMIYYKVTDNLWCYSFETGKITLNGRSYSG